MIDFHPDNFKIGVLYEVEYRTVENTIESFKGTYFETLTLYPATKDPELRCLWISFNVDGNRIPYDWPSIVSVKERKA